MRRSWERQFPFPRADCRTRGAVGFLLAGLLAALAVAGCCRAPDASEPTAALGSSARPGNPLAGHTWQLSSLRGAALLEDTYLSLVFEEDELRGFAGCNHYGGGDGGRYEVTPAGGLAIPLLAHTVIDCLEPQGVMEQEDAYFEALRTVEAFRLEDGRLSLQNAAGDTLLTFDLVKEFAMDPAGLPATSWQLVSLDGEPPLAGSVVTLTFLDEERASSHAGCRDYVAGYQADEAGLTFVWTAVMGTICASEDLMRQEGEYTTIMGWTTRFHLQAERLELHTIRGEVLVFEPLPWSVQADLEGSTWSLMAFLAANPGEGLPVPMPLPTDLLAQTEITATFTGGQMSGTAGCNHYGGSYQVAGTTLSISDLVRTEMACLNPEGVMAQEQRYLDTLRQVALAHLYANRLWLETPDGDALVFAPGEQ